MSAEEELKNIDKRLKSIDSGIGCLVIIAFLALMGTCYRSVP